MGISSCPSPAPVSVDLIPLPKLLLLPEYYINGTI